MLVAGDGALAARRESGAMLEPSSVSGGGRRTRPERAQSALCMECSAQGSEEYDASEGTLEGHVRPKEEAAGALSVHHGGAAAGGAAPVRLGFRSASIAFGWPIW